MLRTHPNNLDSKAIREQVLETLIDVMRTVDERGEDGWKAAERAFPGTPSDVIAEAFVDYEGRKTDAWWKQVERTIDGEIVRNALVKVGGAA